MHPGLDIALGIITLSALALLVFVSVGSNSYFAEIKKITEKGKELEDAYNNFRELLALLKNEGIELKSRIDNFVFSPINGPHVDLNYSYKVKSAELFIKINTSLSDSIAIEFWFDDLQKRISEEIFKIIFNEDKISKDFGYTQTYWQGELIYRLDCDLDNFDSRKISDIITKIVKILDQVLESDRLQDVINRIEEARRRQIHLEAEMIGIVNQAERSLKDTICAIISSSEPPLPAA